MKTQISPNYFRIALQSGLAAAVGLGLPAGVLLWLILIRRAYPSGLIDQFVGLLQINGSNKIILLALCSLVWSYWLAKISGYRPWWKLGLATALGIIVGWFLPLSNLAGWFREGTPVHIVYAAAMCGIVASATICVGLAYGLILRNTRSGLAMALKTTFVAVVTLLLTMTIFDHSGFRVGGTVPLAMSKVTVTGLLASAIAGGAVLGVEFTKCRIDNEGFESQPGLH